MSFIITMYVREGIVMAADSRLTLNTRQVQGPGQVATVPVPHSDSNYKLFLAPGNIGISTFGAADIQGVPIAGFIETFMNNFLTGSNTPVDAVPQLMLNYIRQFQPVPDTQFHIAGYKFINGQIDQHLWHVHVTNNTINRLNVPGQQGCNWGGEVDVFTRLIQNVGLLNQQGVLTSALPYYPIPFQFFTLQDAIDFSIFAVKSTIDLIRFQPRPKTIGGPIDVLVIKPDGPTWIQRKALRGESGLIKKDSN
jgi:hypothetical protein